jgi:hypothetical protein
MRRLVLTLVLVGCLSGCGDSGTTNAPPVSEDTTSSDATSGDATSGDATSGDATSGDATSEDVTPEDVLIACVPSCDGLICGDDGCDGTCGAGCALGANCIDGTACEPVDCYGHVEAEVCEQGSSCMLNQAFDAMYCTPDGAEGEPCAWGFGKCLSDLTCVRDSTETVSRTCQPRTVEVGEPCGYGMADCVEGAGCRWTSTTEAVCKPLAAEDETCGWGEAGCVEGLSCHPTSIQVQAWGCYPPVGAGEDCSYGYGSCIEGWGCLWDANPPQEESPSCYPNDLAEGEVCGYGIGLCGEWRLCTTAGPGDSTTICKSKQLTGTECGFGIGSCLEVTTCTQVTAESVDSVCMKNLGLGDACGVGLGYCWAGLECVIPAANGLNGTCQDACLSSGAYDNGACEESCWRVDPDCF